MPDSPSPAISRQTIKDLARLARLDLTPDEEVAYQKDLAAIIDFVNQLKEADIADCSPLHQVGGLVNRWRCDQQPTLDSQQQPPAKVLLSFWPDRLVDGQFKTPRPLTGQSSTGS